MRRAGMIFGLLASAWCLAGAMLWTFGVSDADREFINMLVVGARPEDGLEQVRRLELLEKSYYVSAAIGLATSLGGRWLGRLRPLAFCVAVAIPFLVGATIQFVPMPDRLFPPALVVGPLILPTVLALFSGAPSKPALAMADALAGDCATSSRDCG